MRHDSSARRWIRLPGQGARTCPAVRRGSVAIVLPPPCRRRGDNHGGRRRPRAPPRAAARPTSTRACRSRRGSADLLGRMTLPEKIGQMVQIEATQVTDTTNNCTSTGGFNLPNPVCEQKIFVDRRRRLGAGRRDRQPAGHHRQGRHRQHRPGLGQRVQHHPVLRDRSTRGCTSRSSSASTRCTASATRGRRRCSRSRSGWARPGTRPPPRPAAQVTANALRATGWNWDFAPVQDLARDNRWGRYYETWAEEPVLAGAMGAANVRGHAERRRPAR